MQPNSQIDLHDESRGDCATLPGPCAFVSCRHNLDGDAIRDRAAARRVCQDNCAIRIANDTEGLTLEEIGTMLGVSRERVRQIEASGLREAAYNAQKLYKLDRFDLLPPERPNGGEASMPIRRAG